jgi:hypothetical protein
VDQENQELEVTHAEALNDLRGAMGIPQELWTHDDRTWTVKDLMTLYGLGDQAARNRAWKAVDAGLMIAGTVRTKRGFIDAFRLAPD